MKVSTAAVLLNAAVFTHAAPPITATPTAAPARCATPGPGRSNFQIQSEQGIWPYKVYKSSSMRPPNLTITGNGKPLAPGYVFLEPSGNGTKESAPWIMTSDNDLVFGLNISGTTDFRVQKYEGKPYLTFWEGYNTNGANIGHGYGKVTVLDDTYCTAYTVCPDLKLTTGVTPVPECQIDIHEHQLTPRNTMLISAYNNTPGDLTPVGGSRDGYLVDSLIYEVDITTNEILFRWSSIDHVPVSDTKLPLTTPMGTSGTAETPFDYFHVNSIQAVGKNYLINARHTWTTYLVGPDGAIIWRIEGNTGGDFGALPAGANFRWQHFARIHNETNSTVSMSLFNNNNINGVVNPVNETVGLELLLQQPPNKSKPPQILRHLTVKSNPLYAVSQGSYSATIAGSKNQFMGYGAVPVLREYGPATDGSDLRWQARFGTGDSVQSYRGFKAQWHGTPSEWNPSLALEGSASSCPQGYVSWNGATDVVAWNVYEGTTKDNLKKIGSVPKRGFETAFNFPGTGCVQVGAVQGGKEVRKSNVVCIS